MLVLHVMSRRLVPQDDLLKTSGTQHRVYVDQRSAGLPDEVERMADTNSERKVDEEGLTHGVEEVPQQWNESELFGRVPVKRQRREGDSATQIATAQD